MFLIDMVNYLLSIGYDANKLEEMTEYEIEDAWEIEMKDRIA
jgi:hypothetical protein